MGRVYCRQSVFFPRSSACQITYPKKDRSVKSGVHYCLHLEFICMTLLPLARLRFKVELSLLKRLCRKLKYRQGKDISGLKIQEQLEQ